MDILGGKKRLSKKSHFLQEFKIYQWTKKWRVVWLVDSGNLKKKPVKYLSIFLLHYTPPPHYTALAYHPTITKLNHLALMHFTYATDVANTTHVLRICNICRICNTCTSHMQHMLHKQHMSHMQHMCFAYATYVAYATHFYKIWFFFKSAWWNIFYWLDVDSCTCGLYQTNEKPTVIQKSSWRSPGCMVFLRRLETFFSSRLGLILNFLLHPVMSRI